MTFQFDRDQLVSQRDRDEYGSIDSDLIEPLCDQFETWHDVEFQMQALQGEAHDYLTNLRFFPAPFESIGTQGQVHYMLDKHRDGEAMRAALVVEKWADDEISDRSWRALERVASTRDDLFNRERLAELEGEMRLSIDKQSWQSIERQRALVFHLEQASEEGYHNVWITREIPFERVLDWDEPLASLVECFRAFRPYMQAILEAVTWPDSEAESSDDSDDLSHDRTPSAREIHSQPSEILEGPNLILRGPPRTGKTHRALEHVAERAGLERDTLERAAPSEYQFSELAPDIDDLESWLAPPVVWDIVSMHSEMTYETMVRDATGEDQLVLKMAELARLRDDPTILILDDCHRAELASMFGGLRAALEPDKRGRVGVHPRYAPDPSDEATLRIEGAITLPEEFEIIGTMRASASVDTSLYGCFRFLDLPPAPTSLEAYYEHASRGRRAAELLSLLNRWIDDDSRHVAGVGHGYLMVEAKSRAERVRALRDQLRYHVGPLLEQYARSGYLERAWRWHEMTEFADEQLEQVGLEIA